MAGAIIFVFIGIAIVFCIYLFVDIFKNMVNTDNVFVVTENVAHKPYDYWDDAGDGSGVNYVPMPDGSVRID